jgi:RpiB/LacA/LacB family sugar-phosphate isomerase
MSKVTFGIASDHAGFDLKTTIIDYMLNDLNIEIEDYGPFEYNKSDNYPYYAITLCIKLKIRIIDYGILICGTGIGMSIVANRFQNVRAARCLSVEDAKLAKSHNNANVLCLGGNINDVDTNKEIVNMFCKTNFSNEIRHVERVNMFNSGFNLNEN